MSRKPLSARNVSPGINLNSLNHRNKVLDNDEINIVNTLKSYFYITGTFNTINIRNSKYKYFFLKLTDESTELFGVRDEIIVLMSPFKNFEPRTLDAIEEIQNKISGFRLDKICAVVICKDDNFIEKLNSTIKSQEECRLIIPFTYSELSERKENSFFRERIAKFFFERNLFNFDSPLRKDMYFFGRDDFCQTLLDNYTTRQSSSVFGLRRSGKTSILLSLQRRMESQKFPMSVVDCQVIHLVRWNIALYQIVTQIKKDHKLRLKVDIKNYSEDIASISFRNDIDHINNELGKCILIAFDEVEQITFGVSASECWHNGSDYIKFWHMIRSLYQKADCPITILISGTNPKCLEIPYVNSIDNPLYGQIRPKYLPGFDIDQTKQMLQTLSSYMGITIEEDVYTYIVREFGGHPFLMRQFCSYVKETENFSQNNNIDRLIYDICISQFYNGSGSQFCEMVVGILNEHYKDEYDMLNFLSQGDIESFNEFAKSDSTYTMHLLGYGILSSSGSGYDFRMDSVKKYLLSKNKYKKISMSNPEKLAEISERRNRAELSLRRIIANLLITKYDKEEIKNLLLKKYDASKKRKYGRLDYKELLDANKSEIMFNDLKDLIRNDWESCFKNVFEGNVEEFSAKMLILNNTGRSDAHAKKVNDDDMMSFRGAMEWLETKIENYNH